MKQNDDENDNNKISLKTVLVGETSVGKTSIIKQFTKISLTQKSVHP